MIKTSITPEVRKRVLEREKSVVNPVYANGGIEIWNYLKSISPDLITSIKELKDSNSNVRQIIDKNLKKKFETKLNME